MTREVKYNGLRKRDTYEEIIDLLQSGESDRIQYPNRIASQIMNSPYMKQIDGFSLLDLQQQQERQQKEILKQMMMKNISEQTGIHYTTTQHLLDREKRDGIAEQVKRDLSDTSEFASVMDKSLDDDVKKGLDTHALLKQARAHVASKFVNEIFTAAHGSPAKLAEMAVNIGQVSPQRPADPDKMVAESGLVNEIARKAREEELVRQREYEKEQEAQAKKIRKEQHEQEQQDAFSEAISSIHQQASDLQHISGSHASQVQTPVSSKKSSSAERSMQGTPGQPSDPVYVTPPRRITPRPENYHIASPERSEGYGISPIPPKSSSGPTPASSGSRSRSVPPHNHTPSSAHTPSHSPGQSLDQSSRRTPASAHTPSGSPPPSQTQSSRSRSKSRTPASAQTPSGSPPSSVRAKSKSQASTPSKYYGTPSGGRYVYK